MYKTMTELLDEYKAQHEVLRRRVRQVRGMSDAANRLSGLYAAIRNVAYGISQIAPYAAREMPKAAPVMVVLHEDGREEHLPYV